MARVGTWLVGLGVRVVWVRDLAYDVCRPGPGGQQRIEGFENIYGSPVAAGDRIYTVSRDGSAVVFRAGDRFEVLATNELDDVFNATPAIVGDTIVLRGERYLYNIAGGS